MKKGRIRWVKGAECVLTLSGERIGCESIIGAFLRARSVTFLVQLFSHSS